MDVAVMAAGLGKRFGGLKQLAPVGDGGEAILDVVLARAAAAGFDRAVVIVGPHNESAIREHLARRPVEFATQSEPRGTAHTLLAARDVIDGPFAAVNADDLYPAAAFAMLAAELRAGGEHHTLVAFELGQTLLGEQPVKRATLAIEDGALVSITEGVVDATADRSAWVSMNMWGFRPSIFDALDAAVASQVEGEVLLPDVVARLVANGATVRVLRCHERCIGITHPGDLELVRAALS